jgi:hypothetical protein
VHFWRMGSADRSPSARPCRPATAFDFPSRPARARAETVEVLALLRAGRPAPGRAPPRAIDYSCGLILFKAPTVPAAHLAHAYAQCRSNKGAILQGDSAVVAHSTACISCRRDAGFGLSISLEAGDFRAKTSLIRLSPCSSLLATQSRACRERSEFQSWAERSRRFLKMRERLRTNVPGDLMPIFNGLNSPAFRSTG